MSDQTATEKLAAFGAWCAREFRTTLSDVDGGSAQDEMERLGVIVIEEVTERCGEECVCSGYGEFPHHCYVFPPDIAEALCDTKPADKSKWFIVEVCGTNDQMDTPVPQALVDLAQAVCDELNKPDDAEPAGEEQR